MQKNQETAHADQPLAGVGVLVTRPQQQADALCEKITALGGEAIRFPVLEIVDSKDTATLTHIIDCLDDYDLAIFISANAVQRALNLIRARRTLPDTLKIAAIGRASARELKAQGCRIDLVPAERFNSEALLDMEEMRQVTGKRILIFRGEGGRELLADTLRERGATVEYAEVYRRVLPSADTGQLLHRWARDEINIITVTSNESLHNLVELVGKLGREWLRKTPLVVISDRMLQLAQELGIQAPVEVAAQADDDAIIEAILALTRKIPSRKPS